MPTRRMPTNKLIVSLTVVTAIALVTRHEAFAETIASNEANELMPADAMPMSRAAVADPDITMRALRSRDPTETETSEERNVKKFSSNSIRKGLSFIADVRPSYGDETYAAVAQALARASNSHETPGLPHGGTSSHQANGALLQRPPFGIWTLTLPSRGPSGHPAPGLPHGGMRGQQAHGASPHGPPFGKSSLNSLPHGPSGQQAHGGPPHGLPLNNPPLNSLSRGPSAAEPQPTIDFLSKGLSGTDDNKPTIDSLADADITLGNRNDPRRSKVLRQPVEDAAFPGPGHVKPDVELGLSIGGTSRVKPDVELGLSIGGTSRVETKAADDAQSGPSRLKRKREDSEFVRNVRSGGDA